MPFDMAVGVYLIRVGKAVLKGTKPYTRRGIPTPYREERKNMSLYGNHIQISGVTCGMVMRGSSNGKYLAVFEREFASLEDIEAISWDKPDIQGDCILPAGYGFTVADIQYAAATRSYTVELQVAQQYLGDVAGYEAQVSELEGQVADLQAKAQDAESKDATIQTQQETIQALEESGTAKQVEDKLEAAYQEGVESNG